MKTSTWYRPLLLLTLASQSPALAPAAARYAFSDRARIRASIASGFRAPEVFDEDFHITNIGGELQNIVNDPGLKAERSLTADLRVVELSAGGKLTGPMDIPHVVSAPDGSLLRNELATSDWFFTVDVAVMRRFSIGRRSQRVATAGIRNAFNNYQDDLDAGPYRDSTYVYGPRFPRTYYASLQYEF